MKKQATLKHFAGMLDDVAFFSDVTGDKPKAKALRKAARKIRAKAKRPMHMLDLERSGDRTQCGKVIGDRDVRWTTGWRVSDNPPYRERREKVTCAACLKRMEKKGIVL